MKKSIVYILLIVSSINFYGCKETDKEPVTTIKEKVNINIKPLYNGKDLIFNTLYKSFQNNNLWFTNNKFYLSDIVAIKKDGSKNLLSDIALIDFSSASTSTNISGSISQGEYVAIQFGLGVKPEYNMQDPATYVTSHPLSVSKNMYWGWATQYIFSKLEGFEVQGTDTTSFIIHTGTQDLYRPEIMVPVNFTVSNGGNDVTINYDLYNLLYQTDYSFDLVKDGQSHTLDHLSLATQYMDNFVNAFN